MATPIETNKEFMDIVQDIHLLYWGTAGDSDSTLYLVNYYVLATFGEPDKVGWTTGKSPNTLDKQEQVYYAALIAGQILGWGSKYPELMGILLKQTLIGLIYWYLLDLGGVKDEGHYKAMNRYKV